MSTILNIFLKKVNRTVGPLRKFHLILPRHSLVTIYKTFITPHVDYGDVIYNRAFNESFSHAMIPSNIMLQKQLQGKLFPELGLEILKSTRWFRKLYLFHKIFHSKLPNNSKILFFNVKTSFLKNSFFSAVITECNNLDISIGTPTFYISIGTHDNDVMSKNCDVIAIFLIYG